jgi:Ca-activated chloride channel family protein
MSQYTSFVAVEERIVNVGGQQRTIDVPVEMPDGVSYEGIFGDERREAIALGRNMRGANRSVALGQMYFARPQSRSAGGAMGGAWRPVPPRPPRPPRPARRFRSPLRPRLP